MTTLGATPRVVRVLLDPEALNAHQLSVQEVRAALQASNVSHSAGSLVQNNREVLVQTGNFLSDANEVSQLVVGVTDGKPVFLRDVAEVQDGADQPNSYVWLGTGAAAGDKSIKTQGEFGAVTLAVTKKPGENAVDVADKLLQRVEELKGSVIPADVQVTTTRNYGETANDKAMKLIKKLFFATFAVVALVWFALGRREAVIVGIAVLLTLAVTLFASWAYGFTLNRVSLFALIFSIGILVDDAIVVVENIHRRRELAQHQPLSEIIPEAVDEVGSPTILATFTVIAALLPMAFVSGLMGPYMSPIPINASMGMLISLAIAFIVTPWLALKLADAHHAVVKDERDTRIAHFFRNLLTPFLNGVHGKPARRKLWLGILAGLLLAVSLAVVKLVVLKMLPFDNKSEFQVVVDMPSGTALEQTSGVMHEIGAYLATVPEVTDYEAYAGTASPINFNGLVRQYYLRSAAEQGDIQVNLRTSTSVRAAAMRSPQRARADREDRQEMGCQGEGRRSAARSAGDVAHRGRDLRAGLRGRAQGGSQGARTVRRHARHRRHRRHGERSRAQAGAARDAEQGGAARCGAARHRGCGTGRAERAGRDGAARCQREICAADTPGLARRAAQPHRRCAQAQGARHATARWCRCRNWCRW